MNVFEHSTSRIRRNLFRATAQQVGLPEQPPFPLHLLFHRYLLGSIHMTRVWQDPPAQENQFLLLTYAGVDPSMKGQAVLLEVHRIPPFDAGGSPHRCPACLSGTTQELPKTLFVRRPTLTLKPKSTPVLQENLLNKEQVVESQPTSLWYCTGCGYKFSPPEHST